jgi:hypothetical protein
MIVDLLKHTLDETKNCLNDQQRVEFHVVLCNSYEGVTGYKQWMDPKWKEYRGTRYSDGDNSLVVELWLHRVVDDLSGLTFQCFRSGTPQWVVGNSTLVLSVENDNYFRSRCELIFKHFGSS